MIEGLYQDALDLGITLFLYDQNEFWNRTYGEVLDIIEFHNKQKVREMEQQLFMSDFLASRTSQYISTLFDKNASRRIEPIDKIIRRLNGEEERNKEFTYDDVDPEVFELSEEEQKANNDFLNSLMNK